MGWHSVRVRLTLWNVLVLACVLGGFGAALCYSVQANQAAAIDRDLAARGRGLARRPPPEAGGFRFRLPGTPGGPDQMLMGPTPDLPPLDRRDEGPGRVLRFGRRRPLVPRAPDDVGPAPIETNNGRVREFRRPLYFSAEGKPPEMWADDLPWDRAAMSDALAGLERYSTVLIDGERVRVFTTPVRAEGAIVGSTQTAHPLGEQERLAESQIRTLLLLIPAALLVAGVGGLFLTNRALRPVREVTHAAAQIGAGDLSRRLRVEGKDELAELSSTFNGMIGRLEYAFRDLEGANAELAQAFRKLEAAYEEQRRFTGDASHELRTPLTRIKGSTSLALYGPHDADSYREALVVADEAADAMARIVQDLLLLARSDAGQLPVRRAAISLEEVLQRAVEGLRGEPGPAIILEPSICGVGISGDADHLVRLFGNLLENAVRHTPPEGRVTLSAEVIGDVVGVRVADTGEGIPPEHLPRVCERFYRVDAARTGGRGGTGLGLAICQSIVQAHEGTLAIESRLGEGTRVTVTLPAAVP